MNIKSLKNGKNIYREGAKNAKDIRIQDLQDFLLDLCGLPKWPLFFHRPWRFQGFGSYLPGLDSGKTETGGRGEGRWRLSTRGTRRIRRLLCRC
jgi:hypothetical protein